MIESNPAMYMQDHDVFIDLPHADGLQMRAVMRGDYAQPVVLLVHGRPGDGNGTLQYTYARELSKYGIASLRVWLYDFLPNTRNLLDATLEDNAADLETAATFLRENQAPRVFGVGHSYGGLALLASNVTLDAAVLWDPTHGEVFRRPPQGPKQQILRDYGEYTEVESGDYVITVTGKGDVKTRAMRDHDKALGDTSDYAAHKGYPLKVIGAERGIMNDLGARYVAAADEPKQHVVLPGATHNFLQSDAVTQQLFDETTEWLQKYA